MRSSLFLVLSLFILSACGEAFIPVGKTTPRTFKPADDGSGSGGGGSGSKKADENYVIHVDRTGLTSLQRPTDVPPDSELKSELARRVRNIKISKTFTEDDNGILSEGLNVRLKLNNTDKTIETIEFQFTGSIRPHQSYYKADQANKYALRLICREYECEQAWLLLGDVAKKQFAEVRFERKEEYLTKNIIADVETKQLENTLLQEALQYGYPVERHSVEVVYGQGADVLIVQRPPADVTDEDFENANNSNQDDGVSVVTGSDGASSDNKSGSVSVTTPESVQSQPVQEDILELETTIQTQLTVPKVDNSEAQTAGQNQNKDTKDSDDNADAAKSTPAQTDAPRSDLYLTDDPNAYYQLQLPSRILKTNVAVSDPLALKANFTIKPISQQEPFEPAYRITEIAKAFIAQNIKIHQHACNIYVRAVMALSGYTGGGNFLANDFHRLFMHKSQNLHTWEKSSQKYRTQATYNVDLSTLQKRTDLIPEGYSVIMQVVRSHVGRHGHVALLTRENGDLVVYDASIRRHGPRRTVVKESQLLNRSRSVVNIFSLPQLLRSQNAGAIQI